MKHRTSRRFIAPLLFIGLPAAALLCALPAAAWQTRPAKPVVQATDISGPWLFDTSGFDTDCTMSGTVSFSRAGAGAYSCKLKVETHCKNRKDGVYEYWRVAQSCSAKQTADKVEITSRIDRVESATWFGKEMPAATRNAYRADNFSLTIAKDKAEMNGRLYDPVRTLTTRMWRDVELIS